MAQIEWVLVKGSGTDKTKAIGAIGFVDGSAATVVAFYDDADANKDGKVSVGEWLVSKMSPISMKNSAVVEVAMAARYNFEVLERDASFNDMAMKMFLNFAGGLVRDGVYAAYFARGVRMTGGGLAKTVTDSTVKQFVVRKGFESGVKEAFQHAF